MEPLLSGMAAGRVWTLDAPHTNKRTARLITGPLNGHNILFLKGNQPLALQAAQALLCGTDVEFAEHTHRAADRGHRRTELRTVRVAGCDDTLFPGARQVFRLRRDTAASTGNAPARKSCTASPAWTVTWPAPRTSTTTPEGTGRWKAACTTSGT